MLGIQVIEGNGIGISTGIQFFQEARGFVEAMKEACEKMAKEPLDKCPECTGKDTCKEKAGVLATAAEEVLAAMEKFADAFNDIQDFKKATHGSKEDQETEKSEGGK